MLAAIGAVAGELGERHPEHALDLRGLGPQVEPLGDGADLGDDVAAGDRGVEVVELAAHGHQLGVEPDLLVRFAQRGVERRLARIHPPAGKAHLTAMAAHLPRASSQQHLGPIADIGEQHQHGRVSGIDRTPAATAGPRSGPRASTCASVGTASDRPRRGRTERPDRRAGDDLATAADRWRRDLGAGFRLSHPRLNRRTRATSRTRSAGRAPRPGPRS